MGHTERRDEILKTLCRERKISIKKLAEKFGVSVRTIQRDIEILSITEPIFTQCGRYGGVHIIDGYFVDRMYMSDKDIEVLHKIYGLISSSKALSLSKECKYLKSIILRYTKPKVRKEQNL